MNPDLASEIARLRALNLSPKQIARKLALRPAEVSEILRSLAADSTLASREKGALPALDRCLINEKAAQQLLGSPKAGLIGLGQSQTSENQGLDGLAEIIVLRKERNNYLLCLYLVDYWCLGVKNAVEPRKLDQMKCQALIRQSSTRFNQDFQEISLEQAQAIIFGAVDYAAKLGLQPHPDYEKAKAHLGEPLENLPRIEFGRQGKPCYVAGPYDNSQRIIAKLQETAGAGNFNYFVPFEL